MLDNTGSTSSKEEASNKTIESCTSSETTLIHTLSNHSKYTEISNTVKKSSNYLSKKPQPKHNKSHSIFQSPSSSPKLDHSSAGISGEYFNNDNNKISYSAKETIETHHYTFYALIKSNN